jgi:hypothetical protein
MKGLSDSFDANHNITSWCKIRSILGVLQNSCAKQVFPKNRKLKRSKLLKQIDNLLLWGKQNKVNSQGIAFYQAFGLTDGVISCVAIHETAIFRRSRVRTLNQAARSCYGSRVRFPGPVTCVRPIV